MFLHIKQTKDTGVVAPCAELSTAFISYFLKKSLISSLKRVTRIEITATKIIKTSILDSYRQKSTHTPNLIAKKKAQAPKGLEPIAYRTKSKLTTYQMVKNILAQNGEKIPKVFGLLQIFSLAQKQQGGIPLPLSLKYGLSRA